MAALKDEVKRFIVQALACFDTPTQVVQAVKETFGVEVSRQQCEQYDPTKHAGRDLGVKWKAVFEDTRKRFREETAEIPIANRAFRLRTMNRFVERAETMKNIGLAMQILEQAAKEVGDVYVNRNRKDEPDDEPAIPTRIQVDVVDARKPNAEP
ncbi:DUF2280 domain-containing protein [Pseudomonas shahriarae]|uniref:DUF2280 domain-containing protein n=1 Tax=Pseudomonas shahriarae TaxID=2745512 RepID=A0A9X4C372_9PSED|nr:DUF2280 domain-containing protein [Pseudomonas shahriarae]MDD1009412.1 DUF2280 domain-containing protein [Pseudomonas shahriarae]